MRPQRRHGGSEQLEHTCAGLALQLDAFGQPWWPSPDPGNSGDTAGKERTRAMGVRTSEEMPRQPRAVCSCQVVSSPPFDPSLPRAPQWACYSGHRIGSVSSGGAGRGWDPVILSLLSLVPPVSSNPLSSLSCVCLQGHKGVRGPLGPPGPKGEKVGVVSLSSNWRQDQLWGLGTGIAWSRT